MRKTGTSFLVCSNRTRGYGFKLNEGRITLELLRSIDLPASSAVGTHAITSL